MSRIEIRHDTGYGLVPRRVMRDSNLSIQAKAIYSYLASFAGNTGKSFPSTSLMAKELNISKDTLFKYLRELREKEVITVEKERTEGSKFGKNIYYLHNKIGEDIPCPKSSDTELSDTKSSDRAVSDTNSNNLNSNNINNKDICSDKSELINYKGIIEYLNKKANRQFNYKARKNRSLIKARVNEGYTEKDFYKVIDVKVKDWLGNPTMEQYLRPSTLFSNKFDQYLNETSTAPTVSQPSSNMPVFK